jgi:hypothetical protein
MMLQPVSSPIGENGQRGTSVGIPDPEEYLNALRDPTCGKSEEEIAAHLTGNAERQPSVRSQAPQQTSQRRQANQICYHSSEPP